MFKYILKAIVDIVRSVKGILGNKSLMNTTSLEARRDEGTVVVQGDEKFSWVKWFAGQYRFVNEVKRNAVRSGHKKDIANREPIVSTLGWCSLALILMGCSVPALMLVASAILIKMDISMEAGRVARDEFFAA